MAKRGDYFTLILIMIPKRSVCSLKLKTEQKANHFNAFKTKSNRILSKALKTKLFNKEGSNEGKQENCSKLFLFLSTEN